MGSVLAWFGIITPLLVAIGVVVAALRWSHRTAHHWQKVWGLPAVVDKLAESVSEHTTEMTHLKEAIEDRFPLLERGRQPDRERRGQQWRQGGGS